MGLRIWYDLEKSGRFSLKETQGVIDIASYAKNYFLVLEIFFKKKNFYFLYQF